MPELMDLPAEVRCNIVEKVFHVRNEEAPENYEQVERKRDRVVSQTSDDPDVRYKRILDDPRVYDSDSDYEGRNACRLVWRPKSRYRASTSRLERVNKQLHSEVKKVRDLLSKKPAHWVIGLTYLRHVEIACNFITLPVMTDYVDTLTIEFRALNSGPELFVERTDAYLADGRSEFTAIDSLFAEALQWILECGPASMLHLQYRNIAPVVDKPCRENDSIIHKMVRRGIKVKTLVIDFLPATEDGMFPLGPIPGSIPSSADNSAQADAGAQYSFDTQVNGGAEAIAGTRIDTGAQAGEATHDDTNDQADTGDPADTASPAITSALHDTSAQDYFRQQLGPDWSPVSTDEKVIVSEILCAYFHQVLRKVTKRLSIEQDAQWCHDLYKRVGRVKLRQGGKTKYRINLLEELKALDENNGSGDGAWVKAERMRIRRAHELDLPGPMMPFMDHDASVDYSIERRKVL